MQVVAMDYLNGDAIPPDAMNVSPTQHSHLHPTF